MTHGNALVHGDDHDPLLMRSDLNTGTHTSSCGHMMHAECWQGYVTFVKRRESNIQYPYCLVLEDSLFPLLMRSK